MVRLLLCDDSPQARALVRAMLAGNGQFEIVGEAENGSDALAQAFALEPDVVLMDVAMPLVDGIEATRRLREMLPTTRIVALAGSDEVETIEAMLDAGASAYCIKGGPVWELERAIAGASEPLFRLGQALARSQFDGVGQLLAREVAELTNALCAATYLSSAEAGLSLAGLSGAPTRERFASAPGVVVRAFREAVPATADAHELAELYRLGIPCGDALSVPLIGDGVRLGALLVAMPANVQFELDHAVVAEAAELAARALAQERRAALTFAEARRDALTGLPNRRAFEEHLDSLLDEHDVGLVLLDVDNFKQVNDTHGHAMGDEVLSALARVLLRTIRSNEQAFRIGGDEFAIVVVGGSKAARRAGDRVLRSARLQSRGLELPTLSAGLGHAIAGTTTKKELFAAADAALYDAKGGGRDRLVVADEHTAPRPLVELPPQSVAAAPVVATRPLRLLVVDDDPGLLMLLRTTFEIIDIHVDEARDVREAEARIAQHHPDVIVLDVAMPGLDGISFCRQLKSDPERASIPIVMLSGGEADWETAGAQAFLQKPFSPLDLLALVEELAGGLFEGPFRLLAEERPEEQLLLYARDLRRLLELERSQRHLVRVAYEETIGAFAGALAAKDFGTAEHSKRVVRYATELTRELDPALLEAPGLEHGFLLHDVGKIGIPDAILQKREPLTQDERRVLRTHPVIGAQLMAHVPLLRGPGLSVIRSHHERWDGSGYPDLLRGQEIPLGGRIFAVADALDAMTSERPYRRAFSWDAAASEIVTQAGKQFDPDVVDAFREIEPQLMSLRERLAA